MSIKFNLIGNCKTMQITSGKFFLRWGGGIPSQPHKDKWMRYINSGKYYYRLVVKHNCAFHSNNLNTLRVDLDKPLKLPFLRCRKQHVNTPLLQLKGGSTMHFLPPPATNLNEA